MFKITFWGFDGSSLSHGSGFLVLFKLETLNKNVASLCILTNYMLNDMPEDGLKPDTAVNTEQILYVK